MTASYGRSSMRCISSPTVDSRDSKHRKSLILAVTFPMISFCSVNGGTRIRSCRTER